MVMNKSDNSEQINLFVAFFKKIYSSDAYKVVFATSKSYKSNVVSKRLMSWWFEWRFIQSDYSKNLSWVQER